MRVRFAPSPSGQLHVGNARTALFNWLLARQAGGTFVLRIEDTDAERSTPESEETFYRDLRWLGLDWDEGPNAGGPYGPYRSSDRLHLYQSYAAELLHSDSAYYCFCSTERLEAERRAAVDAGLPAKYAGTCSTIPLADAEARLAAGETAAIRFRVPPARDVVFADAVRGEVRFHTDVIGDPVILRAGGMPAYNFAVVVDDALMRITHVVRGEDHISNTPRQILLFEAMGFEPPKFAHLAMVLGPDHTKLSKRHGATSVAEFRAKGYLPEALVNYLALVGWSPKNSDELMPLSDLVKRFSLDDVVSSAGVFDEEKLAWVNRHHLKMADAARLAELAVPFFQAAGIAVRPDAAGMSFLASVVPIATAVVDRLEQVPQRLQFLFDFDPSTTLADGQNREEMGTDAARAVVSALAEVLVDRPRLDRESFRAAANDIKAKTGQKGKPLFHPIRVALTGRSEGPELDLAIPAIERGADLPAGAGIPKILGCRERAAAFVRSLR